MTILWIGIGGMIGALSRYYIGRAVTRRAKYNFPLATWLVNISGSLLLGILYGWLADLGYAHWLWMLLGIGFCGAFTTFSTFGYETVQLINKKKYRLAIMYVASSLTLGLVAVWGGITLAEL